MKKKVLVYLQFVHLIADRSKMIKKNQLDFTSEAACDAKSTNP